MSLLTSPHQPPPAPPASSPPSPSAVPNDSQSPKQHKEPLSHRLNDFMASKPKMHCLRSLRRGVSVCVQQALCMCVIVSPSVSELLHCMSEVIQRENIWIRSCMRSWCLQVVITYSRWLSVTSVLSKKNKNTSTCRKCSFNLRIVSILAHYYRRQWAPAVRQASSFTHTVLSPLLL